MSARVINDTRGKGLEALQRRLRAGAHSVLVGVPKGPKEADGLSVAQVAAWTEFGTSTSPERPFLRTGILRGLPMFRRLAQVDLVGVAEGRMSMDVALERMGVAAAGAVKKEIVDGPAAPNAPSTIAKKGSSVPRIDSGMLRQSITHVIADAGGSL